ncbi:albumin [Tachyglossus aculeatus]|uniref:albumin n=1 Tax=Tachyglossus aculeatus TaxID=9261 RepID=UPI0018F6638F|nr:albumin [Tachyglossus aculeatus]
MKWVTFISVLLLFSSAHSRELFRRDAHKSELGHRYKELGEDHFKALALVTFSQYLQKCPFDRQLKLAETVLELAKACADDESHAGCDKSPSLVFAEELCKAEHLQDSYAELAECCTKADAEKAECLLKHKDDTPDVPPFTRPEAAVLCKEYEDNKKLFVGKYLYEVARRHPYAYGSALLYYAHEYEDDLKECCKEADQGACLKEKIPELKEKVLFNSAKQRFRCATYEKFGERAMKAALVAKVSQKFPKADFADVHKVVEDLAKVVKECCHGDQLECMKDRADLTKHLCENQDTFSSKLKTCCDKPLVVRSQCVVDLENDETPADLPTMVSVYVEDKEVCNNYAGAKDLFLATFLYDYARRNTDFSTSLLLRVAKGYQAKLTECCAGADPNACLAKAAEELKAYRAETQTLVQSNCDLFGKFGEYGFQNTLLVRYTRKFPQVSTPTLLDLSHHLAHVGTKCCKLDDTHKLACADDYLALVLDKMCRLHEKTPVSNRVTKCCADSLADRRPCFSALGPDETFVPKEFEADTFTFHEDLCTLPEDQQKAKKQTVLVELVKHKPKATDEQLKEVTTDFTAMVTKCCAEAVKEACFAEEGAKLVAKSKALLA